MGLFGFLSRDTDCPACGERAAKKTLWGRIRCPNRACVHFDEALLWDREGKPKRDSRTGAPIASAVLRESKTPLAPSGRTRRDEPFDPARFAVVIQYTNYLGEHKTFTGDRRTVRRRGRHFSVRVAPTGTRIALARERVGNVNELEQIAESIPTPREQAIMARHRRRGTTSPLFEQLRQKYPDW